MTPWLSIAAYRAQFQPMPSDSAVRRWIRDGRLESKQPGGKGGMLYVREKEGRAVVSVEDEMREAIRAASQG